MRFGPLEYALAILLSVLPVSAEAVISTGGPAAGDASQWSTILLLGTGTSFCTATIVGPETILTSASCAGDIKETDAPGWMRMIKGTAQMHITCAVHPKFEGGRSSDLALCKISPALPIDRVERVGIAKEAVRARSQASLVGYGCADGVLRTFDGQLNSVVGQIAGVTLPSAAEQSPLVVLTGAVACAGDTGGGVFITSANAPGRSLAAVISSSDGKQQTFAAPIDDRFVKWANEWSAQNSAGICGVTDEGACSVPELQDLDYEEIDRNFGASVILAQSSQARSFVSERADPRAAVKYQRIRIRKGERVKDVLRWTCASITDDSYMTRALAYLAQQGFDADKLAVGSSTSIEVPLCPPASAPAADRLEKTISDKDADYLYAHFEALDPRVKIRWIFQRDKDDPPSDPGLNSRYFIDVFQALNPDQNPKKLRPGKIILPLRPYGLSTTQPVREAEGYSVLVQSTGSCSTENSADYPFNFEAVLRVLSASLETAEIKPVRAILIDSGLYGAKQRGSVFRKESLYLANAPTAEKVNQLIQRIKPRLADYQAAKHGTEVASIMLGGPIFARLQTLLTTSPIQLDAQRLYEELPGGKVHLPAESLKSIFDQLKQGVVDRAIVNMSMRSSEEIVSVRENLGPDKPFLFITAAGNGIAGKGQLLSRDYGDRYPAVYGGPKNIGASNLITVAALRLHNGNLEIAPFSDFGNEFVEIAALGCEVPALDFDPESETWDQTKVTGTSFSTPLVSFAAGLIASQIPGMRVTEVKQRILASSDLVPSLTKQIVDGRSLNVAKAIGVFFDSVSTKYETSFGSVKLRKITGEGLNWNSVLSLKCSDGDQDIPIRSILKIAPWFNKEAHLDVASLYPDRLYLSYDGYRIDLVSCSLPPDVKVAVTPYGATGEITYGWDDVTDLVFRTPSAR